MMKLLGAAVLALDWADYCTLTPTEQLIWEERGNDLTKSMLFLMNSKNDIAKKNLCLAYSKRNKTASQPTTKAMAKHMSTQYHNKNSNHLGADTEVTSVGVLSRGQNNMEGFDKNVAEKSKSNKEQTEEGKMEKVTKTKTNENEQELNTKTE